MSTHPSSAPETVLRSAGLRVTRPRLAVLRALASAPHSAADAVLTAVRTEAEVSTQAVYDVLNTLTSHGVVRRFQPAGSVARYELRAGDDHHHLVCRGCGAVTDVDCSVGAAPCLDPVAAGTPVPGFVVDEAEVTFWGLCQDCGARTSEA
ncbi:Fur family transcriptional regulator [uncultured Nocardioides sp.]|uniref:Fur family transcriptional regulator n=1 Tax=uncultured Nocardioides sp. TaxID=198441 RepID=UPI0026195647|nr:Fur family transcriptional regulator [uncultured Nocardioides sp.]